MTEASTKQHPLMPLCHVVHAVYRPRPETAHIRCRPAHYPIPLLFLERQHLGSCPISTVSFDSKLYDQVARQEPVTFRGDSVTMAGHERMASMLGMPIIETPVLIIGSSMVGMTLSALLAKHGVRDCVTIERHPSTAIHPRAALFHPRTMQIYRELGLYDKMYAESLKHYDEHAGLHIVETLAGKHLGTYMKDINEWIEDISPTHRLFLTQQMFEPLLRQRAIDNGAVLRFSTELVDFQHDQEGVTALIRNVETGEKQIIRAKYMVACDGNRSPVREKLGIKSQGHGLLSHSLTIYFDADLGKFVKDKYNGVIYVENEHVRGFFRLDKTGREGFLVVNTAGKKGTEESRHPSIGITDEKAGEMLRAAIGADVDFKITHLSPWDAECNVAEHFNDGKIILAGDAAHVVTPHGMI
jgi:2-polyprenyl-6-methoxyphenol hydroxylase-like FAD-dependent oxidoreductase